MKRHIASENEPLVRYEYQPGQITQLCKQAIQNSSQELDQIAAIPASDRNIDNTLLKFETSTADLTDTSSLLTFMGYVSTDEKLRNEGSACEEELGKYVVTIFTRKDLYDAFKSATPRNPNETRLLSETVRQFEKNGLKLPADQLAIFKEKKQKLAALEAQFSANLNKDNTTVEFTPEELAGVPASIIAGFQKTADGSKYVVATKETAYMAIMQNASNEETRKKFLTAYYNRAWEANVKLLKEAVALRAECAKLLGFKTWADYRTQDRMAKNGDAVLEFMNNLKSKLAKKNKQDVAKLLKFKRTLNPKAREVYAWDVAYLTYQLKKRDYSIDDEAIKPYFPTSSVIRGLFETYSKLFGVQMTEVKDAKVWHPDVKLYQISDVTTQEPLAYFYADLFPRVGKYNHQAAFNLINGRMLATGKYSKPVSAIVGNMNPPTDGKPSLMTHDEVETLFHEFGHIMHQTLTRAPFASLAGSSTAQDFVEAPSQMLEHWAWTPEILKSLSGHYQNPENKIPDSMIKSLVAAKHFNEGYTYTRQLLYGMLDMTLHTSDGSADPDTVFNTLHKKLLGIGAVPDTHFAANFGHLMGGYDAGYYGYLWSKVYADDMGSAFKKAGMLNSELGGRYRRIILEKGNMDDAMNLLVEFLGRQPNNDAFFEEIGVKPTARR